LNYFVSILASFFFFLQGGDLDVQLHSWKKNGKIVDKSLVLTWFVQLVLAVQYIHQRRVLHRDLKTRNIFVKSNMVKIGTNVFLDFQAFL